MSELPMETLTALPVDQPPDLSIPKIQPGDLADMSLFAIATWYTLRHLLSSKSHSEDKQWRLLVSLVEAMQISNRQLAEANQIIMAQLGVIMERLGDIETELGVEHD